MLRASRNPFFEDVLELSLDHDTALALHGEILTAGALKPFSARPNTERLLTILERHLAKGDLTEFGSYDWKRHPADCPARAGSVYYCDCGADPERSRR